MPLQLLCHGCAGGCRDALANDVTHAKGLPWQVGWAGGRAAAAGARHSPPARGASASLGITSHPADLTASLTASASPPSAPYSCSRNRWITFDSSTVVGLHFTAAPTGPTQALAASNYAISSTMGRCGGEAALDGQLLCAGRHAGSI